MPELTGTRCLCRCCGRTFRNLAGFDAHRPDRDGCGDPADVGLVERDGLWATPESHTQREASAQRLETVRSRSRGLPQSAEQAPAPPGVPPHG